MKGGYQKLKIIDPEVKIRTKQDEIRKENESNNLF